ncbi:MAG TPA: MFS transporter [Nocardioidaceae bacterium]|nr:MFS transporter [Nocardioidaceae bacterium]
MSLVLLIAFEAMAVATAMPVAARELDGLGLYAWSFTGFLIASLFATAVAGEMCDRTGPAWPFFAGVVTFMAGLVVAGLAPSMWPFIAGRMIQGLGGGTVIVALYVLVARTYDEAVRPRIFSFMAASWVLPSIVGPLVAGVVTQQWSWRWVFLGLVPFVVAPVLLTRPALRALAQPEGVPRRGRARLALAVAVGAALLQYAGQRAERGDLWVAVVAGVLGIVLVAPGLRRLLPAGTMRVRRGLPAVIALRGAVAGAFFGAESYLPLMVVEHRGLSATLGGLTLTGAALGWAGGSWWQGRPSMRLPRQRLVVVGASLATVGIAASGTAAVAVDGFAVPVWAAAGGWAIGGAGMGLTMSCLSVLLFELSPVADQGANSAAIQMADALGSIVMIGAAGVLYAVLRLQHPGVVTFGAIFAMMTLAGIGAVWVATRVADPVRRSRGAPATSA